MIHGTTVSIEPYAVVEGGVLVVPVRPVCEMLGANVDWNHAERSIRVTRAGHLIQYVLGRSQATVSRVGEGFSTTEVVDLSVAPHIRDGYAFAPLDSITKGLAINAWADIEAFSCTVRADPLRPRSSLRLRISPPGARLAIDSSPVGALPPHPTNPQESLRTVGDLAPGPYLVRVELEGYETWEETIDLKPSLNVLDVVLRQGNRGRLRVLTEPPGGQVWIDGETVGTSPLSGYYLPPGAHAVRLVQQGHDWSRAWEGRIQICSPPNDLTTIAANLHLGWVAIRQAGSKVSWATDFGGLWGWDPLSGLAVFAGRGLKWVDLESLEVKKTIEDEVWNFVGWSQDARYLAYADGEHIVVWDGTGSTKLGEWSMDDLGIPWAEGGRAPLKWLPDGRLLGVSESEWTLSYWTITLLADASGRLTARVSLLDFGDAVPQLRRASPVAWVDETTAIVRLVSYARKDGTAEYSERGYFSDIVLWDERTCELEMLTDAEEGEFYEPMAVFKLPSGEPAVAYSLQRPGYLGFMAPPLTFGYIPLSTPADGRGNRNPVAITSPGEARWVSWAPDGRTVLYSPGDGTVMSMRSDGTVKQLVFHLPNVSGWPRHELSPGSWARDGKSFYLRAADDSLWILHRAPTPLEPYRTYGPDVETFGRDTLAGSVTG